MDGEAWRAAVHGVARSRTQLSDWTELSQRVPSLEHFFIIRVGGVGFQHFLRELSIRIQFLAQEILPHDSFSRGCFLFFFGYTRDGNVLFHLGFVFMISDYMCSPGHTGLFAVCWPPGERLGPCRAMVAQRLMQWSDRKFTLVRHDFERVWKTLSKEFIMSLKEQDMLFHVDSILNFLTCRFWGFCLCHYWMPCLVCVWL